MLSPHLVEGEEKLSSGCGALMSSSPLPHAICWSKNLLTLLLVSLFQASTQMGMICDKCELATSYVKPLFYGKSFSF